MHAEGPPPGGPSRYVCAPGGYATRMSEHEHDELTDEELAQENGEPLPDREVMSTIRPFPEPVDPGHTLPIEPPATE
jgi:hypothetical protein